MTVAIYPGSFDPMTNGHLDIAARAATLFEKLISGAFGISAKHIIFTTEERVALITQGRANMTNVTGHPGRGLTAHFGRV